MSADQDLAFIRMIEDPLGAGVTDRAEALRGIAKSIGNARRLTVDAESLLTRSAPSAAGLAAIALEELSKIELLYLTATITDGDSKQWQAFWRAWRAHGFKAGSAVLMFLSNRNASPGWQRSFGSPRQLATSLVRLKECSWYVEHFRSGFRAPTEMLGDEHIAWVVAEARRQTNDESAGPQYDAWVYDNLHKYALGAQTQRDLILANQRMFIDFGKPEAASDVGQKLTSFSARYLDSRIFDNDLPEPLFADNA